MWLDVPQKDTPNSVSTGYSAGIKFSNRRYLACALHFIQGCYHVLWKTTQRSNTINDGPIKTVTFDPDISQLGYETDYPSNTISIFGEWERLPIGEVNLESGEYDCKIVLSEESFHRCGGALVGNWAGAMTANIGFTVN